jgi:phage shock protein C
MRERLYRSRGDRMLFGVAGGMARYFNLDPAIVRLVWVLLFLAGGAGILLYIVAAIVIPEEPAGYVATAAAGGESAAGTQAGAGLAGQRRDTGGGAIVLGLVLVLAGGWFLAQRFFPQLDAQVIWPAVLIVLGLVLVAGALRRSRGDGS